jgi:putative transposase
MIERGHPRVSISRQCERLKLSRSSVYYVPREPCQEDLELMYLIDRQHLETPYYGSRKMQVHLQRQGHRINRKRVQRLMRTMGIQAVYPRPRTSIPGDRHKIYPYRTAQAAPEPDPVRPASCANKQNGNRSVTAVGNRPCRTSRMPASP